MDCREFRSLTKDFIFDDIKDKKVIEEYLEHADKCSECYDELEVIYSMHRSLGDVMGPDGKDSSADYSEELKEIKDYYQELFIEDKRAKLLRIIIVIVIVILIIIAAICLWLEII